MGLENLTGSDRYLDSLVSRNPRGTQDLRSRADDHIRGIKNVLKNTFGMFTGAMDRTAEQIGDSCLPGIVRMWMGDTPPDGWVICNGQTLSRDEALFDVIGIAYGAGDGTSTFNVPDLTDRFPYGDSPGSEVGEEEAEIVESEIPAHLHEISIQTQPAGEHDHVFELALFDAFDTKSASTADASIHSDDRTHTTDSRGNHIHTLTGDTEPAGEDPALHANVQPYIRTHFIIKL